MKGSGGVPGEVFHASQQGGLKVIHPRRSTHGKPWVYATKDPVMAGCFLGTQGGDFTCAVGRDPKTGKPYVCERLAGALDMRYGGVRGSIYILPGDRFLDGQTQWEEEVVCPEPVVPLGEIRVPDAGEHLFRFERQGKLLILRYPERIAGIPDDDEDLVYRAVVWTRTFGAGVVEKFAQLHPHLVERVQKALVEGKYADRR